MVIGVDHMTMKESERSEIMTELGRLAETIKRAYATNDVELYLSAFHRDAIVSMPGIPPVRGHKGLRDLFENKPELPPGAKFAVEPSEVEALSPEWAYAFGTDTLTYTDGKKDT